MTNKELLKKFLDENDEAGLRFWLVRILLEANNQWSLSEYIDCFLGKKNIGYMWKSWTNVENMMEEIGEKDYE